MLCQHEILIEIYQLLTDRFNVMFEGILIIIMTVFNLKSSEQAPLSYDFKSVWKQYFDKTNTGFTFLLFNVLTPKVSEPL